MDKKFYNLGLTEGEVRAIGCRWWLRKYRWQSLCGFIGCGALMIVMLLVFPNWEENHILAIVGAVLAFCSFVVPFLWWQRRMDRAGKKYLKEISN